MPSPPSAESILQQRLAALLNEPPAVPLSYESLRDAAASQLSNAVFDYIDGGAGTEHTMTANRAAFERYRIVPRVLKDVSERRLQQTLFDRSIAAPIGLAPVGRQLKYHDQGERASARAAADLGIPFALSTAATCSIEQVASTDESGPRYFQLYWPRDDAVARSLVDRAKVAGYEAIVVTVDSQLPKWRPRNLATGYAPKRDARYAVFESDPVVQELASAADCPIEKFVQEAAETKKDTSLTWDTIGRIREWTSIPVVLKGILSTEDAARAVNWGADGIVVSNHGGRQIDGEVAALDQLPAIADEVGDDLTVLFDSGIRSGADVFKAIALGADAVLVGRPYIFALAIAGQRGVVELVQNYCAELESTMALCGIRSVGEIDRRAIVDRTASK